MAAIIDYTKYTLTLAIAMLLYVADQFVPSTPWGFWRLVLLVMIIALGASAFMGIMVYTRATTMITREKKSSETYAYDGWVAFWAAGHIVLLIVCAPLVAGFFFYDKGIAPVVPTTCDATFDSSGKTVHFSFPCAN